MSYLETLNLDFPSASERAQQRIALLQETMWSPTPTTAVSYVASDRVLIIGDEGFVEEVRTLLSEQTAKTSAQLYYLIQAPTPKLSESLVKGLAGAVDSYRSDDFVLTGHLGSYQVSLAAAQAFAEASASNHKQSSTSAASNLAELWGIDDGVFDQVIDGGEQPQIAAEIAPPGYFAVASSGAAVAQITQADDLIGEFDKPKYFTYDADICAHGRSDVKGCQRCITVCPTNAITSLINQIEVDPYLCQGGGSCTSVCPSGAITYNYPNNPDFIGLLRDLIKRWHKLQNNQGVCLVLFDQQIGHAELNDVIADLPDFALPVMVEELGVISVDILLCAQAYGANQIHVLTPPQSAAKLRQATKQAVEIANTITHHLQLTDYSVNIHSSPQTLTQLEPSPLLDDVASFAVMGDKRALVGMAIQQLRKQSGCEDIIVELPDHSPFGNLELDVEACTLCMSCVSQCPAKALQAGGDVPALRFIERNCLQCGICANSCPEQAISLKPRYHLEDEHTRQARTLKEEEPFHCLRCGKAFASQGMMKRMSEKLAGHWMFSDDKAMKRLKMCENCRVVDMFEDENSVS